MSFVFTQYSFCNSFRHCLLGQYSVAQIQLPQTVLLPGHVATVGQVTALKCPDDISLGAKHHCKLRKTKVNHGGLQVDIGHKVEVAVI